MNQKQTIKISWEKGLNSIEFKRKEAEKLLERFIDLIIELLKKIFIQIFQRLLFQNMKNFKSLKNILDFVNNTNKIDSKTKNKIINKFPEIPELDKEAYRRIWYYFRETRDLIQGCEVFRASTDFF